MDKNLKEKLLLMWKQKDKINKTKEIFLRLKSNENSLYSRLFLLSHGKNNKEKEANVYLNPDWEKFQEGLLRAQIDYDNALREYEIYKKAYEAEYLSKKMDLSIEGIKY